MNTKILLIGGTWDNEHGYPSGLVNKFSKALNVDKLYNGGNHNDLKKIIEEVKNFDVVVWWANVDNELEKIRDVKQINPKVILITSKRNDFQKYSFASLINRALGQKANLVVEFSKINTYRMRLFDPLGNLWYEGISVDDCAKAIKDRIELLTSITRAPSIRVHKTILAPKLDFYEYVKDCAETFHTLIAPEENVTRFLGNSSFRCQKGFPSFRLEDEIYVSRRNIDKRFITKENFVRTFLDENNNVCYYGNHKPSVDTPIQLHLYSLFPNINYMMHAHCYIQNAVFTDTPIPCGAIEEVNEILHATKEFNNRSYAFNLLGHGCIIMGSSVNDLKKFKFYARKMPENMY